MEQQEIRVSDADLHHVDWRCEAAPMPRRAAWRGGSQCILRAFYSR